MPLAADAATSYLLVRSQIEAGELEVPIVVARQMGFDSRLAPRWRNQLYGEDDAWLYMSPNGVPYTEEQLEAGLDELV